MATYRRRSTAAYSTYGSVAYAPAYDGSAVRAPRREEELRQAPRPKQRQHVQRKALVRARAEVREAENSGGRTLCCGNYHMMRATDPGKSAAMRQRRISQFRKDTAVASYCEGCLDAFRSEGLETVHVLEALFGKSKRRGWGNRIRFTLGIGR